VIRSQPEVREAVYESIRGRASTSRGGAV
jgi:hypothetical protein